MNDITPDLMRRSQKVVWHPFFQHGLNQEIVPVASGRGAYLILDNGREILDGISSWWVNIHGHCNPNIVNAIQKQASKLDHVIFSRFTHEPAVQLAETLTQYQPISQAGLSKVFFSDNGSTAVEVALKMAYQYHVNRGDFGRERFLALRNSYHGDTLGAMAVGEPEGFHQIFKTLLTQVDFVDAGNLTQLKDLLQKSSQSYAGFIFEPLIQGACGMRIYEASYLQEAVNLCKSHGIVVIADEVFTGFYRTGTCFAFEQAQIQPDLMCLSKGITGGFLPLAVTLASERIYSAFLSKEIRTAFLHGHSYTANPISCAAALESWKLLHSPESHARIEQIISTTQRQIQRLSHNPNIKNARCIGTIGAVDLGEQPNYFSSKAGGIPQFALKRGVLLRPLGNVVYVVPPYCISRDELVRIYDVIEELANSI